MRKAPKSNNNNKELTKQRCCVLCCCCCGVYLFAMVSGSCRRQLREPCTVLRSHVPFSLYLSLCSLSRDANHCQVCSSKCQHLLPLFNSCDFHVMILFSPLVVSFCWPVARLPLRFCFVFVRLQAVNINQMLFVNLFFSFRLSISEFVMHKTVCLCVCVVERRGLRWSFAYYMYVWSQAVFGTCFGFKGFWW